MEQGTSWEHSTWQEQNGHVSYSAWATVRPWDPLSHLGDKEARHAARWMALSLPLSHFTRVCRNSGGLFAHPPPPVVTQGSVQHSPLDKLFIIRTLRGLL
jgi:hypothetical protein